MGVGGEGVTEIYNTQIQFQTANPAGFKCQVVVPRGVLCLSRSQIRPADRRREWRVCHLQDTKGEAYSCTVEIMYSHRREQ